MKVKYILENLNQPSEKIFKGIYTSLTPIQVSTNEVCLSILSSIILQNEVEENESLNSNQFTVIKLSEEEYKTLCQQLLYSFFSLFEDKSNSIMRHPHILTLIFALTVKFGNEIIPESNKEGSLKPFIMDAVQFLELLTNEKLVDSCLFVDETHDLYKILFPLIGNRFIDLEKLTRGLYSSYDISYQDLLLLYYFSLYQQKITNQTNQSDITRAYIIKKASCTLTFDLSQTLFGIAQIALLSNTQFGMQLMKLISKMHFGANKLYKVLEFREFYQKKVDIQAFLDSNMNSTLIPLNDLIFNLLRLTNNGKGNRNLAPPSIYETLRILQEAFTSHEDKVEYLESLGIHEDPKKVSDDLDKILKIASLFGALSSNFIGTVLSYQDNSLLVALRKLGVETITSSSREELKNEMNDAIERTSKGAFVDVIKNLNSTVIVNLFMTSINWESPFKEPSNGWKKEKFTCYNGSKVSVPMMHQTHEFLILKNPFGISGEAVLLPYSIPKVSNIKLYQLIIHPKKPIELDNVIKKLAHDELIKIFQSAERKNIDFSMPEINLSNECDLLLPLKKMGVPLKKLVKEPIIGDIESISHIVNFKNDKNGTTIEALTLVEMTRSFEMVPTITIDSAFISIVAMVMNTDNGLSFIPFSIQVVKSL